MVIMNLNAISILGIVLIITSACVPKYQGPPESFIGDTNPERFLMIGGTFSSGYTDDALFRLGQENSIGAFIHQSINSINPIVFNQPLIDAASVGLSTNGLSRLILGNKTDCLNETSLSPVRETALGDASILNNIYNGSPFHNMSIPNLRSGEFFNTDYSNQNPFFSRMASSQSSTVIDDVNAIDATFFSVFLGLDDFMPYIKSGTKNDTLPDIITFENNYRQILENLTSNGAKGVVSTLPDITSAPYFSTVKWNDLVLDSANNATLNNIYNPLDFYFNEGENPFMIEDPDANMFGIRPIEEGELIILTVPLDSVKCYKMGTLFPFRNEFILTQSELQNIRTHLNSINDIIRSLAIEFDLGLVESETFFDKIQSEFPYNGINLNTTFVSGGAYGLDGIRFNSRTNALFANEFIKLINQKYNANYPLVNATNLDAAFFP